MAFNPELELHKAWLGFLQPIGLVVSPHALVNQGVVPSENVADVQARLLLAAPAPDEDAERGIASFAGFAQQVLEWPLDQLAGAAGGPPLPDLSVPLPEHGDLLAPTHALLDASGTPLLAVWELPRGTELDRAPETQEGWHASPQAKLERLLRDKSLLAGLLCNGLQLRLVVAPRGETSGHLTFPVPAMCGVAGRPLLAALHMLLGAARLLDVPKGQRLPDLLIESRKYQNQVSTKLSEQVLGALWELLRGFQAADALAQRRILGQLANSDPNQIYGGLLTVLLRLVFLLYAEHRGLMPDDEVFRENYSVGGLYDRLRSDAGRYPDTMDQRYGAWAWLLTLFRLVHRGGGHGRFRLPAREGELFDPQRYPFLEGLSTAADTVELIDAPRVSDGCIFRVLQGLLVLEGERLSYRTLDVEQIGSVYESMMGFAVEQARGHCIAVRPSHVVVDLDALLKEEGAGRAKKLKELSGCDLKGRAATALAEAGTPDEVVGALERRRSDRTPMMMPPGALYLQPGEERRRSGSHYTPRELTEPIVRTTLRPILERLGDNPRPEQLLSLKVCDPAMGSGAFLVETCRQLAEQLLRAWEKHRSTPSLPPDEEALLHARRLVAQRCLYGVDRNPFAVSLAKLSLWLVTLARDHAFTFLDHALKHGDSLVGLTRDQIARFHWAPKKDDGELFSGATAQASQSAALRAQIGAAGDDAEVLQRQTLRQADELMLDARLAGDLVVLAFFSGETQKQRDNIRLLHRSKLKDHVAQATPPVDLRQLVEERLRKARRLPAFHWQIEFPEVFERDNPGFDAMVGNPPFAGKNTIGAANPEGYIDWLKKLHEKSHGNADLVAHFFRRAFDLLRKNGAFGLIATNTIAQGDTRSSGLRWICKHGGVIYHAKKRYKWPLPGAAVVVSVVHALKGVPIDKPVLDGREVERISAFLFHRGGDDDPAPLSANAGKSFQGCIVLGMGFTFDDSDTSGDANPLRLKDELIAKNPRNAERIFPYIGGEELNEDPEHRHHRYVINFGEMAEQAAREGWPDLMQIVERKVRPSRLAQDDKGAREKWWQFIRPRPELAAAIAKMPDAVQVFATPRVSLNAAFIRIPSTTVASEQTVIFTDNRFSFFAVMQSYVHEAWARFFSSSLEDRLRYAPSDCFETFPLPDRALDSAMLIAAGRKYYEHRAAIMVANAEGLTKTYNRFHDPDEQRSGILRLRELRSAMDRAVLDAYGWTDIPNGCDFELDYGLDEDWGDKKKPWRFRWPEAVRDDVLVRLLEEGRKRALAEKLDKAAKKAEAPTEPSQEKRPPAKSAKPAVSLDLFEPSDE